MDNFPLFYSAFSEVISVLSIWKNRLCAMVVKDRMNKLGRRVPLELGYAMEGWMGSHPFALLPSVLCMSGP